MKYLLALSVAFISILGHAQADSTPAKAKLKQYNKKITFAVGLAPDAFFEVGGKEIAPAYSYQPGGLYNYTNTIKLPFEQYGGIDATVGLAVKKRFEFDLLSGIWENKYMSWVPVGADCKFNFTKGKISPFIHFGGGYAYPLNNPDNYLLHQYTSNNGVFATAGLGLYAGLNKYMSLTLSPDYRFIYNTSRYNLIDYDLEYFPNFPRINTLKQFYHQLGLTLALTFY